MVSDPHLPKHLAHFGIDLMKMEKVCAYLVLISSFLAALLVVWLRFI